MGVQYDSEIEDDLFCERLVNDYLNDNDPDKHDSITIDEFAVKMGLSVS
jgi:hypothetical protein